MAYTLLDDDQQKSAKFTLLDDEPTIEQKVAASTPGRLVHGWKDPIDSMAQSLAHMAPGFVNAVDEFSDKLNNIPYIGPITRAIGMVPTGYDIYGDRWREAGKTPGERIDKSIRQGEKEYQQAREATGNTGADIARFAGNVSSPATVAISKFVPGSGNAAVRGAVAGGLGGFSQPVTTEGSFAANKAVQTGVGAVTGAVMGPIIEKVGSKILNLVKNKFGNPEDITAKVDQSIQEALSETGQKIDELPPDFISAIRQEATNALKEGRQLDPAALMRQEDFKSLGIKGTLGQVTRDATQYASERNLRGVPGGQPLMETFSRQNDALQKIVRGYGGPQAAEPQLAGKQISDALSEADKSLSKKVGAAYSAARESTGRDMPIEINNLSDDLEKIVKDYGTSNIPSAIRSNLEQFGLFGKQSSKPFTMNDAEQVLQQANKLRSNDPAINSALGEIKTAVKNAIQNSDMGGGPFANARDLAASRFKLQDAIPALKAASEGDVSADQFVRKFLINGDTQDVQKLGEFLKQSNPEAFNQARAQIGAEIERAAFGANLAGDKPIASERLSDFIRRMGSEKLKTFFTPEEITRLRTAARVGGYIHNIPSDAPVNTSNTASTIASIVNKIPGISTGIKLIGPAIQSIKNQSAVEKALGAEIPSLPVDMTPEEISLLRKAILRGAMAGGQSMRAIKEP